MIRQDAGLSVQRFCVLAGVPESSWYRRRARVRSGQEEIKGPWPVPKRRVEDVVHWLALRYPAWGYRKIWALAVARGYQVSMSTVYRIMFERGLVHEARYQAERRELARARRAVFHDPPTRCNRVWQTDFSELEKAGRRDLADGRRGRLREQVLPDLPGHGDQDPAGGGRLP